MAMSDKDRHTLQTNHGNLINNIHDIERVVSELLSREVITTHMEEDILAGNTRAKKIQKLMGILPRRGAEALDKFYQVLVDIEESVGASFISSSWGEARLAEHERIYGAKRQSSTMQAPVPESSFSSETSEMQIDDLPPLFPDPNDDRVNINVVHCKSEPVIRANKDVYTMQKSTRGLCLIINNETFSTDDCTSGLPNREAEKDYTAVTNLFDKLHFDTNVKINLTSLNLVKQLENFSKKDHSNYDCFVLVILSHGFNGDVYGVDGGLVTIKTIIDTFDGEHCSSLRSKPKVCFIQACHAVRVIPKSSTPDVPAAIPAEEICIKDKMETLSVANKDCTDSGNIPTTCDLFLVVSTATDMATSINDVIGTVFIQALVFAFKKYAYQYDLLSLMNRVNALMKMCGCEQPCESVTRLSKDLYFFPGLKEDTDCSTALNQQQPSNN